MPRVGNAIPLVGRDTELDMLRGAFETAESGTASAILLAGEAGVGKSRILRELTELADARGGIVLTGRCLDVGESDMPYLPFAEVISQLGAREPELVAARGALATLAPEIEPPEAQGRAPVVLPVGASGGGVEQDVGQLRLYDAVLGALTEAADRAPVLLAIEDVHWAESSSLHLLAFLIARLRRQRLLIVATYRTDELHRRHPLRPVLAELVREQAVRRVDLAPFSVRESTAFVRGLAEDAGVELDETSLADIAARCEGNAFFAEELFAAAGAGTERLPWALADVLLARVEGLPAPVQRLLRIAAVGGRWVRHARLVQVAEASGLPAAELEGALREAIGHHLLLVDGEHDRYGFRHALLREAVYGELLPGERIRLHGCYMDAFREEHGKGVAAALAHHAVQSDNSAVALEALVTAADEAERLGAPNEALRHTERALRVWAAVPESARPEGLTETRLLREASWLCGTIGRPDRAVAYARDAVRAAENLSGPVELAEALRRLADSLTIYDDPGDEPFTVIERAWALIEHSDAGKVRAAVLTTRAMVLRRLNDEAARDIARKVSVETARDAALRAIEESERVGNEGQRANGLITLGSIERNEGQPARAHEHYRSAIRIAAEAQAHNAELRARHMLGFLVFELGELDEAIAEFEATLRRADESGLAFSMFGVECRIQFAAALFQAGAWDRALAISQADGGALDPVVRARLAAISLPVFVERGQFERAGQLLDSVRGSWRLDYQIAVWAGTCAASMHYWQGDYPAALRASEELLEFFAEAGSPDAVGGIRAAGFALLVIAEAGGPEAVGSTAERVDALLEHAERVFSRRAYGVEASAWLTVARTEHAAITGLGELAERFAKAVEAFDYGEVYLQAIRRLRYARVLLDSVRRTEAAEQLELARSVAEELGAEPLRAAIAELVHRARLGARSAAGDSGLTERERAVLEQVAEGKTNREAGAALYISEKTVSVHLSRAMAKLGANRRAEAVAIAAARGLL